MTAIPSLTSDKPRSTHAAPASQPIFQFKDNLSKAPSPTPSIYIPSRPTLTDPRYKLISSIGDLNDTCEQQLGIYRTMTQLSAEKLHRITTDHIEQMKKSAQSTQDVDFWSVLRKIGSAVLSAFSILFGFSIASSAGPPLLAATLVTSGVLSLTNLAFTECHLWDDIADKIFPDNAEKRKQFVDVIPTAIGIVSGGLALAGGIGVWTTGAISFVDKILVVANNAVSIAEGAVTIGEGVSKGRAQFHEAEVEKLKSELYTQQTQFDQIKNVFEKILKLLADSSTRAIEIINSSIKATEEITLRG